MKKKWLIARYKAKELKKLESNLLNQKFGYYPPKITTKKINSKSKEEILFPGYIFVNIELSNYWTLNNTKDIQEKTTITKKFLIKKTEEYDKLNSYTN